MLVRLQINQITIYPVWLIQLPGSSRRQHLSGDRSFEWSWFSLRNYWQVLPQNFSEQAVFNSSFFCTRGVRNLTTRHIWRNSFQQRLLIRSLSKSLCRKALSAEISNDSEANIQCPLFIISLQKWMFGNAISQLLSTWNWNLQQMYANVTIFQPSKSPIPSSVFHLKKIKGKWEEVTNTRPKFQAVYSWAKYGAKSAITLRKSNVIQYAFHTFSLFLLNLMFPCNNQRRQKIQTLSKLRSPSDGYQKCTKCKAIACQYGCKAGKIIISHVLGRILRQLCLTMVRV